VLTLSATACVLPALRPSHLEYSWQPLLSLPLFTSASHVSHVVVFRCTTTISITLQILFVVFVTSTLPGHAIVEAVSIVPSLPTYPSPLLSPSLSSPFSPVVLTPTLAKDPTDITFLARGGASSPPSPPLTPFSFETHI